MLKRKLFAGVSAVALVGSGAMTASAQPVNWTGAYFGAHGGWGFGEFADGTECYSDYNSEWKTVFMLVENVGDDLDPGGDCWWNLFAASLSDELYDENPFDDKWFYSSPNVPPFAMGHLAGVQLGYRVQPPGGPVVFGGEIAFSLTAIQQYQSNFVEGEGWGNFDGEGDGPTKFAFGFDGVIALDTLTTATAQLGFAVGRVLFYGEGGLALGQFSYMNTLGFNGQTTAAGYVVGGGIEVMATDRLSVFVEYNRLGFNGITMLGTQDNIPNYDDFFCGCQIADDANPTMVMFNFGANLVKAGFNFNL